METLKDARALVIFAIAGVSLITGAAAQYFQPGQSYGSIAIGAMLVQAFLFFIWFRIDAEHLGYKSSSVLKVAIIGLALFAIPYYLFRSRGWRRGLVASSAFIALILGTFALEYAGAAGVYRFLQS